MSRTGLPEGFPFSIDELREAVRRWLPPDHIDAMLHDLVSEATRIVQLHNERSERMREAGREPDHEIDFYIPDGVLAHLTLVSSSAAERVRAVMEKRWSRTRAGEIERERRRAAERAGIIPSMDDLLDEAERRGEFSWDDPIVFRGMVVSGALLPEPPPATPEVIAVAERYVAEDIAEWEAIVAAARAGAPLPFRPNAIGDRDEAMPESELPGKEPDWEFIDDYIEREDRHRRGEPRLFASLARDLRRFNAELVRALRVSPARAVPRVLMSQLLKGENGGLGLASPVGGMLSEALGEQGPRRTRLGTEMVYEVADLLDWYEANRANYEPYPFFDDWRARKRTRREVIWMRLVRDRRGELFPVMSEGTNEPANTPPETEES